MHIQQVTYRLYTKIMAKPHHKKEFIIMRSVALWLHDYTCYVIGCNAQATEVHHDDHCNTNNEIRNLIPLCSQCHKLVHSCRIRFNKNKKTMVVQLLRKIAQLKN